MTSLESYTIDDLEPLLLTLRNTLGVVVADEQRHEFVERVEPLLSAYNLDSFATLAKQIGDHASSHDLKSGLLDAISQSQSKWALSAEIKGILHDYIFRQLADDARIWIVGCEQGQLAYAVAMELANYERETGSNRHYKLIATDISPAKLQYAREGTYTRQQLDSLNEADRELYVTMKDQGQSGEVKAKIRQLIDFRQCDLGEDFQSLGAVDLIICPEVLVYFSNDRKAGIFRQFAALLKSGGIFLTDNSQAMMMSVGELERVQHPAGMFFRKKKSA